jgi:hypothetical protein
MYKVQRPSDSDGDCCLCGYIIHYYYLQYTEDTLSSSQKKDITLFWHLHYH